MDISRELPPANLSSDQNGCIKNEPCDLSLLKLSLGEKQLPSDLPKFTPIEENVML